MAIAIEAQEWRIKSKLEMEAGRIGAFMGLKAGRQVDCFTNVFYQSSCDGI